MSIVGLCVNKCFPEEEFLTAYVKVDQYKYIKLAGYCDSNMYVDFEFIHDQNKKGFTKSFYVVANKWITETKIEPLLPYVRIRLRKADMLFPETELIIHVTGRLSCNQNNVSQVEQPKGWW